MSVPVESDIAPLARLLIYAILPDGELIGDSAKYEVENCLPNKSINGLYTNRSINLGEGKATKEPQDYLTIKIWQIKSDVC